MIEKSRVQHFKDLNDYQEKLINVLFFVGYPEKEANKIAHTVVEVLKLFDGMNQRQIYLTIDEVLKVKDEITDFKFPMPYN